jgi:DNA-binding transcriptional MerR regulator
MGQELAMDDERYSLQELADAAGVSTRTVRYYITEGLLPPPVQAGARSFYTRHQLDRLLLIGLLKDAFLPLKEIRRRLAALTDDELRQALDEAEQAGGAGSPGRSEEAVEQTFALRAPMRMPMPGFGPEAPEHGERDEALDYINRVLGERKAPRGHVLPPRPAPLLPPHRPPVDSRTWRRLPIGNEAELVISDELYRRRKERIEALIAWAERMLTQD